MGLHLLIPQLPSVVFEIVRSSECVNKHLGDLYAWRAEEYFYELLRLDSLMFGSHLLSVQFLVLEDLLVVLTFTH